MKHSLPDFGHHPATAYMVRSLARQLATRVLGPGHPELDALALQLATMALSYRRRPSR